MENDGESGGGAREVNVRRDVEFSGEIEGGGAELVDDEGDEVALSRHGFEEVAK